MYLGTEALLGDMVRRISTLLFSVHHSEYCIDGDEEISLESCSRNSNNSLDYVIFSIISSWYV